MLDYLVWKHYGKTEGRLEVVLDRYATTGEETVKLASVPITEMQSCFLPDGAPRKVEFDIELVHYG